MGKIEIKKMKKRRDILEAAYELFTTIGFHKTTILQIALKAGVGKGTFYLYFDSKEAVREELIMQRSSRLMIGALNALQGWLTEEGVHAGTADKFIFIADYILEMLRKDITLLHFISKNLTWSMLIQSKKYQSVDDEVIDFKGLIIGILQEGGDQLRDPELLLFTLLELVNSTCYNTILYSDPVPFDAYKPYLYACIRQLVDSATE